jgi:hypothetical protein
MTALEGTLSRVGYTFVKRRLRMAVRFLWNATRGHRLTPWRSEYLKWRIETYSGRKADTIDARYFWSFLWKERAQLMRFLGWTKNFGIRSRQSS